MADVPPHEDLVRSSERLRVLAEVSHAFATVATDYHQLIDRIARSTADLVGDGCMVTLLDESGENLVDAASAHRDPGHENDYREYLAGTRVSKIESASISATVARTGEPKLVPEVDPAALVAQADEALRPLVARLNVHSFVVVPIRTRKAVIGTLSLVRSAPGASYTTDDLTLLMHLADRAGLAIENARLYEELEQRVRLRTSELEAANAALEALSNSVGNELRAPLRSIGGFSEALLEDQNGRLDAAGQDYLRRVRGAAQHMGELIDALLGLSRVSRAELTREMVDLSTLARTVVRRLRDAAPEREVEVTVHNGLAADGDRRLLEVVLSNLLGNAWKFTSTRAIAHIEVGVEPGSLPATFFVRDDGVGFDPAYASKIFEAFQRLHPSGGLPGNGIGLATAQRIVRRHGGRIWAVAEVDRGATFFFTLAPPLTLR